MNMKWVLIAAGLGGLLFLSDSSAWAKTPSGGGPSCLINNPSNGAIALRGTVAINSIPGSPASVDVLARLERGGALKHFRLHLAQSINGLTNQEVACRIFNPNDTNDPDTVAAVGQFVNEILTFFGYSGRSLKITDNSISNAEVDPAITPTPYPGGTNYGSMGDITIYAQ
jgi:hypothetical protein